MYPNRIVTWLRLHRRSVVLWAAAIAHVVAGNVDYRLAGTILIGSVPGVWIGSHMSVRLPAGTLRTVLGVVLIGYVQSEQFFELIDKHNQPPIGVVRGQRGLGD